MKLTLIFLIALSCSSCYFKKTNRAERKIQRAKVLDPARFRKDTVFVFSERYQADTITKLIRHDSVIVINNERVKLKYFYDTTRLEIHHEVECKSDTILVEKEVIIQKETSEKKSFWVLALIFAGLLFFLTIIKK